MPGLKVGLASEILNARYSPTAVVRANYLTAGASSVDSLWVPDHLNSLMPRDRHTAVPRRSKTDTEDRRLPRTVDDARTPRRPQPSRAVATGRRCDRRRSPPSSGNRAGL